jgi:hypothetical protein
MKRVSVCIIAAALAFAVSARADPKAAAQSLFDEGRQLMASGQYREACPKFEESERLDAGAGTLMNLADCYEKSGKLASAWLTYTDAISASDQAGRTAWATKAREKVAALKPKLITLTIIADSDVTVTRDGAKLSAGELGVSVPVDTGAHTIVAEAPGKKPWRKEVTVSADLRVTVPPLVAAAALAPTPPTKKEKGRSNLRTIGIVTAAVGVGGIAAGGIFGLLARGKRDDALASCSPDGNFCDANGIDKMHSAHTFATVSTVGFIGGAVLSAAGLAVFLIAPPKAREP